MSCAIIYISKLEEPEREYQMNEATLTIGQDVIELDLNEMYLPWYNYNAWCPPGRIFVATGCHVLGAVGNKAAIRKAIKDGGGIEDCTIDDCDSCEEY